MQIGLPDKRSALRAVEEGFRPRCKYREHLLDESIIKTGFLMFADYFSDLTAGKIKRLRFVGLMLFLVFIFFIVGIAIGAAIGLSENMGIANKLASGDWAAAKKLKLPVIAGFVFAILTFMFASFNIVAKRARDVGLPGWITAIVIIGLTTPSIEVAGQHTAGSIGGLLMIILAFLPTDLLKRG